jgi:hypothetical protein
MSWQVEASKSWAVAMAVAVAAAAAAAAASCLLVPTSRYLTQVLAGSCRLLCQRVPTSSSLQVRCRHSCPDWRGLWSFLGLAGMKVELACHRGEQLPAFLWRRSNGR